MADVARRESGDGEQLVVREADHESTCERCRKEIRVGDLITFERFPDYYSHVRCVEDEVQAPAEPGEDAKLVDARKKFIAIAKLSRAGTDAEEAQAEIHELAVQGSLALAEERKAA